MAFDPSGDIRAALAEIGDPVTLPGGGIAYGFPSIATTDDSLDGDSIVPGKTKVLRFATADVPGLAAGNNVTWKATNYRVVKVSLAGMGNVTRIFLGTA